ncbi:MAG: hypothetical protein DMG26_13530 [Acidobacteria bacterium]|nr:MAG: hypothetical protein DMG26_13530 [Acidobacteriota bacterium]
MGPGSGGEPQKFPPTQPGSAPEKRQRDHQAGTVCQCRRDRRPDKPKPGHQQVQASQGDDQAAAFRVGRQGRLIERARPVVQNLAESQGDAAGEQDAAGQHRPGKITTKSEGDKPWSDHKKQQTSKPQPH